jgi:hypothetical protein
MGERKFNNGTRRFNKGIGHEQRTVKGLGAVVVRNGHSQRNAGGIHAPEFELAIDEIGLETGNVEDSTGKINNAYKLFDKATEKIKE